MDDKALDVNQLITAMANGFTRKEAVSIAGEYVCTLCSKQS